MLFLCFLGLLTATLVAALYIFAVATKPLLKRVCYSAALVALFLSVSGIVNRLLATPFNSWNEIRLAPTIGWLRGIAIFPDSQGVLTGYAYGPIAALMYLPAALGSSPTAAILIGSTLALLITLTPVAFEIFRVKGCPWELRGLALSLFVIYANSNLALSYSMFSIHADAPALGFGAAACSLLLLGREGRRQKLYFVLSAVFVALSIWSKQSMAPILVALPLYLALTRGWRISLTFMGLMALSCIAVGVLIVALFGPLETLVFHLITLLRRQPLNLTSVTQLPDVTAAVWELGRMPLCLCGFWLGLAVFIRRQSIRDFIRTNDWTLFLLLAVCNFPFTVISTLKVGADVNSLSFYIYFLTIAAVLSLIQPSRQLMLTAQAEDSLSTSATTWQTLALIVLALDLSLLQARNSYDAFLTQRDIWKNASQRAYEFELRHPGEAYFPWNPLASLMASGNYYHFDAAIDDRALAGQPISQQQFDLHIPNGMNYVIITEPSPLRPKAFAKYLPDYSIEKGSATYPGWQIFTRPQKQ